MLDFQQKRKMRNVLYHRKTLIVLGILVLLALRSTWTIYEKQRESTEQRNIVERKTVDLFARERGLQDKIDTLQTEHGIEEEIRTKFSVAKENENVVVILDNSTTTDFTSTTTKSFWQRFKGLFGKK